RKSALYAGHRAASTAGKPMSRATGGAGAARVRALRTGLLRHVVAQVDRKRLLRRQRAAGGEGGGAEDRQMPRARSDARQPAGETGPEAPFERGAVDVPAAP